jgi:subtilisin
MLRDRSALPTKGIRPVCDQCGNLTAAPPPRRPSALAASTLSDRECQVLLLIGDGLDNRAIAGRLNISEHTVKTHVTRILLSLGLDSRLQAGLAVHALRCACGEPGHDPHGRPDQPNQRHAKKVSLMANPLSATIPIVRRSHRTQAHTLDRTDEGVLMPLAQQAPRTIRFAHMTAGERVPAARYTLPERITREWAWGSATGAGVRVCVIDSGVEPGNSEVGPVSGSFAVERTKDGERTTYAMVPDELGDVAGHGTACAGIIRRIAPDAELTSVRILGPNLGCDGDVLVEALRWAVAERFDVINLSLSTRRAAFKSDLHDIADAAYFARVLIVASAHNSPVDSFPWRFSSVVSVGSHTSSDPAYLEVNPNPPVEFFASGVRVTVPRPGGGSATVSGNSFATPHVAGYLARIRQAHPDLPMAQVKHVLTALCDNLI